MTKSKQNSLAADQTARPRHAVWLRREMKKDEMTEVRLSPSELWRHAEKTKHLTQQELRVIHSIFVENKTVEEIIPTAGINGRPITKNRIPQIIFKALGTIEWRIRCTSPGHISCKTLNLI